MFANSKKDLAVGRVRCGRLVEWGRLTERGERVARGELVACGELVARGELIARGELVARGASSACGGRAANGLVPGRGHLPVGPCALRGCSPAGSDLAMCGRSFGRGCLALRGGLAELERSSAAFGRVPGFSPASLITVALLAFVLCIAGLAPRAAAADERIDPARTCSLTVEATYDKQPLGGFEFSLRKVASVDDAARYQLAQDYARSGVEVNGLGSAADWNAAAMQLETWTTEQAVEVGAQATSNAAGKATFSALEPGMYLLTAEPLKVGSRTYTAETYLVAAPEEDAAGTWIYDTTSICKVSMTEEEGSGKNDDGKTDDARSDASAAKTSKTTAKQQTWAERLGLVATGDGQLTLMGTVLAVGLGAVLVGVALVVRDRVRE